MHRDHDNSTLSKLVQSTEELLRRTAAFGSAEVEANRDRAKRTWDDVGARAADWQETAGAGLRSLSKTADRYAHRHAWESIGVAALVGAVIAACILTRKK